MAERLVHETHNLNLIIALLSRKIYVKNSPCRGNILESFSLQFIIKA